MENKIVGRISFIKKKSGGGVRNAAPSPYIYACATCTRRSAAARYAYHCRRSPPHGQPLRGIHGIRQVSIPKNFRRCCGDVYTTSKISSMCVSNSIPRANRRSLRPPPVYLLPRFFRRLAVRCYRGRKSLTQGWYEVDLQVGCRLVVVYYSEDMRGNVRWVESISVDRKPIIF